MDDGRWTADQSPVPSHQSPVTILNVRPSSSVCRPFQRSGYSPVRVEIERSTDQRSSSVAGSL
jgi:hypothetical protein